MTQFVLTANHLGEGHVVFFADNGIWVPGVEQALRATTSEQKARLTLESQIAKTSTHVVEPYLVEVSVEAGAVTPVKTRERLRTLGPTVRKDLGYQAGNWKNPNDQPEVDHVQV